MHYGRPRQGRENLPLQNVKARFASITTFLYAQKNPQRATEHT